jgi:cell division protein FtsI/penicillin-binding protein 2
MKKERKSCPLYGIAIALALAFALVGYRLVDLQIFRHSDLSQLAQKNTRRLNIREPLRGQIRDSRGNPLAMSMPAKVICADPSLIGNRQPEIARVIAPLLQTNEMSVIERLLPKTREVNGKIITNQYVVLKRKVSLETWSKIQEAMTNLTFGVDEKLLKPSERVFYRNLRNKAIFAEEDQLRVYPNHQLAAHVIGYVGGDEQVGQNGIERALNSKLTGVRGWLRTETDGRRRELVMYRDQDVDPHNGMNVVLTIDSGLQDIVETELAEAMARHTPISISCVMMRPKTGEILAMATLPTYDPNSPGSSRPEALRNRVITDIAEPGSTFKIVVVSAALNEKRIKLSDVYDCEHGRFYFGGRVLHDHESYGPLTVEQIITKSSNIGSAKIAIQKLGEDTLYDYIKKFGFGTRTGIPLPGEVSGIVHPVDKWSKVSIAQIPMGHGIAVTPMQMVMAMSAIANKGMLMRPMLVSRLEDENGTTVAQFQPQPSRRVVSEEAAYEMTKALKTVPSKDGTAVEAHLENYTVAGKTGTAQKVENGTYARGKYYSSFIGFFPADDPELCISVVMDEPKNGHYGGKTAAPVFKNIAERAARYLNLRPDIAPEPAVQDVIAANLPSHEQRKF